MAATYVVGRRVGHVWFTANCATFCLKVVVQIKELTLNRKDRQNMSCREKQERSRCSSPKRTFAYLEEALCPVRFDFRAHILTERVDWIYRQ